MEKLVLEPTAMAQWHRLLQEARYTSSVSLSEELESYLIFLLMRFINHPEIARNIFALDFLENIKKFNAENQQTLQAVGDKCLLYSGFFPGSAKRRCVNISYYVDLGRRAYFSLSASSQNVLSPLFANLSDHFVALMDVLHSIRSLNTQGYLIDLLEAENLWHKTKSKHALKVLKKGTNGFFVPQNPCALRAKH